mmetsp:Transcript_12954/g.55822  ORF Transcript_12954/g.55822 Transcript_12954/m.55822 type:complete len:221 (-) Transcript_12954:6405-7067(-)
MEHPYNSQPFGYVFRQAYMIRFVIFKFLHEESRVVRLTGFGIPDLPSDLRQHREAMLPDYKSDKERCIFFLKTYSCGDESGRRKYEDMLVDISNRKRESLEIDLADLEEFCLTIEGYENFPEIVQSNARRYASIFAEAADDIMPRRIFGVSDEDDSFDVLMRQRDQIGVEINENINVSPELPDVLRRRFRVYFKPGTKIAVRTVRSIRAADIGHLVTFTV